MYLSRCISRQMHLCQYVSLKLCLSLLVVHTPCKTHAFQHGANRAYLFLSKCLSIDLALNMYRPNIETLRQQQNKKQANKCKHTNVQTNKQTAMHTHKLICVPKSFAPPNVKGTNQQFQQLSSNTFCDHMPSRQCITVLCGQVL